MAERRKSGQLELHYYSGFGGNSYDSIHYAKAFRSEAPHNFGMMSSQLFTANTRFKNKKFTALTLAKGNYELITSETYRWSLRGDDCVEFYITEQLVGASDKNGLGNETFEIALDKGYLQEPDIIQGEHNIYPGLEIVGTPIQRGRSWIYTVRLSSSDPQHWIPSTEFEVGQRFIKTSTSIVSEDNKVRGTDSYDSHFELESQIGYFGNEVSVTDKLVRQEMYARERNDLTALGRIPDNKKLGEGFAFDIYQDGKRIPRGAFITMAEARLLDRVDMDREWSMEFGFYSVREDDRTGRIKRTAPGFRRLVQDGHIMEHNGSLTAQTLEDYLHGIFLQRRDGQDRKIKIATGEGGMRMFDQLLSDEANSLLAVDTKYYESVSSPIHSNALSFGFQYTHFKAKNGIEVELVYDPIKDDPNFSYRRDPDNPDYTIDSFRFDIFDFGTADDGKENMSMVMEKGYEYYAFQSNLTDPKFGPISDGSKVASFDKGVSIMRETSGALWCKDTSRIGSIIYNPDA